MIEMRYDSVLFVFFPPPQIVTKKIPFTHGKFESEPDRYESSATEVWDGDEKDLRWDDDDDDDYVDETKNENEK